ncbi:MAG: histidine kinase [Casimicrobiaceae bacterium]
MGVSIAFASQFLFQRDLYEQWPAADIAWAWALQCRDYLVVAGGIVVVLALAGRLRVARQGSRAALFAVAVLGGSVAGEAAVLMLEWNRLSALDYAVAWERAWRWIPVVTIAAVIFLHDRRTAAALAVAHQATVTRLALEQQAVETQLRILHSQIEPHFLFNTLATIRRLQHTDPVRARETMTGFIHYLRAAMPGLRVTETTLGCEMALIRAYLDVLSTRMEERLRVTIDVPDGLLDRRLPPLSLATLVENSIKHGLASLPEGGSLDIRARIDGDRLTVRVADTGIGLKGEGGAGTGLANLRSRLRSLYGAGGSLRMEANQPRGVAATLSIPLARSSVRDTQRATP